MLKVTLLTGAIFLNILLFNGCDQAPGSNREQIRYENKLDSLYERKIDSAYARIGHDCDSTLAARWKVLEDSILGRHHLLDSLTADSVVRERFVRDSPAHLRDSTARAHPHHHHH
jgi:hypothetical protein